MVNKLLILLTITVLTSVLVLAAWFLYRQVSSQEAPATVSFDGDRALQDVRYQVDLGPRTPGSPAHDQAVAWLVEQLGEAGWTVEIQQATRLGHPISNVIGRRTNAGEAQQGWIVLGAHYDSRLQADRDADPQKRAQPVPGANDGASGVAVLLELARILPQDLPFEVWLVFFDAEDNGGLPGWEWILGSRAFVEKLEGKPEAAVIVDMIGDSDLEIYIERNSSPELAGEIWSQAAELGYDRYFIATPKRRILDDHVPFLEAGIPAANLIDIDYPYWHTTADDFEKVSADSLQVVGDTLLAWLLNRE